MESHFEKILFMQIYTYIFLIETTDYYFKIRIYVPIIFIFLNDIRHDFESLEL